MNSFEEIRTSVLTELVEDTEIQVELQQTSLQPNIVITTMCEPEVAEIFCQTSIIDLPDDVAYTNTISITPLITKDEMLKAQSDDSDIGPIIQMVKSTESRPPWSELSHMSSDSKILLTNYKLLFIKDDLLYRKWYSDDGLKCWPQLVLPRKYRDEILEQCHDHVLAGHTGITRTLYQVRLDQIFLSENEGVHYIICTLLYNMPTP